MKVFNGKKLHDPFIICIADAEYFGYFVFSVKLFPALLSNALKFLADAIAKIIYNSSYFFLKSIFLKSTDFLLYIKLFTLSLKEVLFCHKPH